VGGIDFALLDPADPDERSVIIRGEHPEFAAAFDAGRDEIELDGVVMNPNLHLALHEIVANQLWDGETPRLQRPPADSIWPATTVMRSST